MTGAIPFILMHLAAFSVLTVPFHWEYVLLAVASYYLRMFGVVAGYHRYFSHRSFQLNRFWQFALAFLAETTAQKGVLWWAAHHRYHHQHSDRPTYVHSPLQHGFFYAHVGWIFDAKNSETMLERIPDFAK
jgi:stearoyl-CoA desaturase (delta-9 desaturase)